MNIDELTTDLEASGYFIKPINYRTGAVSTRTNARLLNLFTDAEMTTCVGALFVKLDGDDCNVWAMHGLRDMEDIAVAFNATTLSSTVARAVQDGFQSISQVMWATGLPRWKVQDALDHLEADGTVVSVPVPSGASQ